MDVMHTTWHAKKSKACQACCALVQLLRAMVGQLLFSKRPAKKSKNT